MTIYSLDNFTPTGFDSGKSLIAENASIIGQVQIADYVSIWFGAVVRGDNETIEIGEGTNIQDNCVLHTDPGFPLKIDPGCTVGHSSVLHGCYIGSNTLVGMGSIIMNGAKIGSDCLIAAGTLITQSAIVPNGHLVVGRPWQIKRRLSLSEIDINKKSAAAYQSKIRHYKSALSSLEKG